MQLYSRRRAISKAKWSLISRSSPVNEYNMPCRGTLLPSKMQHTTWLRPTKRVFSSNNSINRSKPYIRYSDRPATRVANQAPECTRTWPWVPVKAVTLQMRILAMGLWLTKSSWRNFPRTCTRTRNNGLINKWLTRSVRLEMVSPKTITLILIKTVQNSLWTTSWTVNRWTAKF